MPQENNFVKIILLKNFANYFDRKIFFYGTAKKYKDNVNVSAPYSFIEFSNINFNPNDGIETQLALTNFIGTPQNLTSIGDYSYLLVCPDDDTKPVISRWFIMDAVRNAEGIYTLTLKRDVVAETIGKKTPLWEAPFFVERGMLPLSKYDPLLLNDEGMNFNQIKQSETLLFDESYTPWIVAFYANNTPTTPVGTGAHQISGEYLTLAQLATETGIPQATIEALLTGTNPIVLGDIKQKWGYNTKQNIGRPFIQWIFNLTNDTENYTKLECNKEWSLSSYLGKLNQFIDGKLLKLLEVAQDQLLDYWSYLPKSDLYSMYEAIISAQIPGEKFFNKEMFDKLNALFEQRMPILYQGNYYYFKPKYINPHDHVEVTAIRGQNTTLDDMLESVENATYTFDESTTWTLSLEEINLSGKFYLNYQCADASIEMIKADAPSTSYDYSYSIETSHNVLSDGAYSMLAIPLNRITYINDNTLTKKYTPPKEVILRLATQTAIQLSSNLIDIQIVPFMPSIVKKHVGYLGGDPVIDIRGLTLNIDYAEIEDTDSNVVGLVFYEKEASYSSSIEIGVLPQYNTKEEANTTLYRLCSPNYSGVFEFNIAKMGEYISYFDIDITYKPFNPFIRVTPEFGRLYGQNFTDGRGLICGGDFSLPVITDQWKTYENNNKMYGQIFARDIQNLELKQDIQRFKEPFSVISGTAVGAGAGALAGAKAGPYGAIAGAVVGAGAGLAGGLIDINLNERMRQEEKRYSFDRFNLNLANIKALPQSLSKNSCLTQINKLVPFIEFYDCSQEEHRIFNNRIKYNGMAVGKIDEIEKYFAPVPTGQEELGRRDDFYFFKAQLIRAEDLEEDNHYISVLYDEFAKGVYL